MCRCPDCGPVTVETDDVAALSLDEDWLRQKMRLALDIESRDGIDDLAIAISPYTGFFSAVILVPLIVAGLGMVTERLLFTRFYRADPLYSLLLTFGLAMVIGAV